MASTDARPIPQKNVAFRVTFPLLDADGDLVTASGSLDSEISKDGGTFTDCTNEATEIATSSGMYFLDLTSTEMNADCVAIIIKSAGAKTTPIVLYPEEGGDVRVNVTQWLTTAAATPTVAGVPEVDVTHWIGTAAATPTVAGVPEVDQTHYLGSASPALVGGRFDSSVGAVAANAITDASVSTDMDAYHAKVWIIKESTTTDHYAVVFFKNGQPVTSGITSPTIQVIKASDGTDLIASTALTEVGSLGIYKKDESTNKLTGGAIYFAKTAATIDGSSRTWLQQIGRDSA